MSEPSLASKVVEVDWTLPSEDPTLREVKGREDGTWQVTDWLLDDEDEYTTGETVTSDLIGIDEEVDLAGWTLNAASIFLHGLTDQEALELVLQLQDEPLAPGEYRINDLYIEWDDGRLFYHSPTLVGETS